MKKILAFGLCIFYFSAFYANASSWTDMTWDQLSASNSCIQPSPTISFNKGYGVIDLNSDSNKWFKTQALVAKNKYLKITYDVKGVSNAKPRRYLVLYRVDPRFRAPQVFIQEYDFKTQSYTSDFHNFRSGNLLKYNQNIDLEMSRRIQDYYDYFNFIGRESIRVHPGEVLNVKIVNSADFFTSNGVFRELENASYPVNTIYTKSANIDNAILYTDPNSFCSMLNDNSLCSDLKYYNSAYPYALLSGTTAQKAFSVLSLQNACPMSNPINQDMCFYDKGRGMRIRIDNQTIKESYESFFSSNNTSSFYYKANEEGSLIFDTDLPIEGMFSTSKQFIESWKNSPAVYYSDLLSFLPNTQSNLGANFIHIGRYAMLIEIGNGYGVLDENQSSKIQVKYSITNSIPNSAEDGLDVSDRAVNAYADGFLSIKVINQDPDNIIGKLVVSYEHYQGSSKFADTIYNGVAKPIVEMITDAANMIYGSLTQNVTLKNISKTLLSVYIIIYALLFLMGATQVTVKEVIIRVSKIAVITLLFQEESWNFFNKNLFTIFLDGTNQLILNSISATSDVSNPFGFIDPAINKYFDQNTWKLIGIQLLYIGNGLFIFSIIVIIAAFNYMMAIMTLVAGYCMAFVGIAVLISLAPIFITFILFERTKGMFFQWIAALFSYMIQPILLFIFFLFIDQLITDQFSKVAIKSCWECILRLSFEIKVLFLHFKFALPFLECIYFYVPKLEGIHQLSDIASVNGSYIQLITSSLLFYIYCGILNAKDASNMSSGLAGYVHSLASKLANAQFRSGGEAATSDMRAGTKFAQDVIKNTTKNLVKKLMKSKGNKGVGRPVGQSLVQNNDQEAESEDTVSSDNKSQNIRTKEEKKGGIVKSLQKLADGKLASENLSNNNNEGGSSENGSGAATESRAEITKDVSGDVSQGDQKEINDENLKQNTQQARDQGTKPETKTKSQESNIEKNTRQEKDIKTIDKEDDKK